MDEAARLHERIRKLAGEKANLQLVIDLMNRLSRTPGLQNTIQSMLACVSETIGGTDSILYYRVDDALYRASVSRGAAKIGEVEDPLVRQVFEERKAIECEGDFSETKMMTPEFCKAWTWVVPLLVGNDLIGVFKIENLHVGTREMWPAIPTFFDFAALVLKNEILGQTRLQRAFDELGNANAKLKKAHAELEQRIEERTQDLASANRLLIAEKERFRVTLASIGDAVISTDASGRITYLNPVAEGLTQWSNADAEGLPSQRILNLLDEFTRKPAKDPLGTCLGSSHNVAQVANQALLIRPDGGELAIEHTASPIRDDADNLIGAVLSFRDITERRRIEQKNSQLAAIVESSDDAIISKTLEGVITSWNKGAELIYGYSTEEAVGKLATVLMPPDREDEMLRNISLIREGRHVSHFETLRRRKDGKEIYLSLTLSPVKNAAGNVVGVSAIERDVTERKRAEQALRRYSLYTRSLIEASLDPLVTISAEGKITDVNNATIRATGASREALIGSDFSGYFTDPEKARAGYLEAFTKGFVKDYPLAIRHKSGHVIDILYNASVYRTEKGEIAGVFAAARDVTERKRAEEALRVYHQHLEELVAHRTADLAHANEELEGANKELESFAYSVSHDLRAPLRAINGFSRILLEDYSGKLGAEGERLLNVVCDSAFKLSQLIDDILAFSRAGRGEMSSALIDMDELVREVEKELAQAITGRKVTFDIKALAPAQGDTAMIRRVWTNLIDNSLKFTALKPEAVIEVGSAVGTEETIYYVKDNGVGFDMQYSNKLFGVFQRLHGAEFPGTGIGLAIVKRIVAMHGGRAWAEGKVNEGATFYFTLPKREN